MANFSQALEHIRSGLPARRDRWPAGHYLMHSHLPIAQHDGQTEALHFVERRGAKIHHNLHSTVSHGDILATDWVLIESQEVKL